MSKKYFSRVLFGLLYLAVAEIGILVGIFVVKNHFYFSPINPDSVRGIPSTYIVTSGSMQPEIPTGGLVFSVPVNSYQAGDVVTFKNSEDSKTLVTHRIVAKVFSSEKQNYLYYTKGDANKDIDGAKIESGQIAGKVIFGLPYLGYAANSAKDPKMFILLVIIPTTIIVYEELKFLKRQIIRGVKGLIKRLKSKFVANEKSAEEDKGINKIFIVIPVMAVFIILAGVTGSFFRDSDLSLGNIFTAGAFPTPTPTPTPSQSPSPSPTPTPSPGERFIDAVTSVAGTFGHCCDVGNLSSDPSVATSLITGAPDSPPNLNFIQISQGSIVTAKFVDNKVVNGPGNDIRIHIYDTLFPATALVEVGQGPDCATTSWNSMGIISDITNTDLDISSIPLSEVQCIRLTDQGGPDTTYPSLGFDLDAIEALNSVSVP